MIDLPQKKSKFIVLIAYLAFTAFFAESFIFTQLNHEHNHDGIDDCCSVCDEIALAQLLLESLGRIAFIAVAIGVMSYTKKQIKKIIIMRQWWSDTCDERRSSGSKCVPVPICLLVAHGLP